MAQNRVRLSSCGAALRPPKGIKEVSQVSHTIMTKSNKCRDYLYMTLN